MFGSLSQCGDDFPFPPPTPYQQARAQMPVEEDELRPVVIDTGTEMLKCGFGGDSCPMCIFPMLVGRPVMRGVMVGMGAKDSFVGDEAQAKRGVLEVERPVEHGIITKWEDIEKIWYHTFYNELRVCPEEHPVMLSEPVLTPVWVREKTVSMMFESFNVPGLYFGLQPILSLYASGLTTGVIVEVGGGVLQSLAFSSGYAEARSIQRSNIGGRDVTECLAALLRERKGDYIPRTTADMEIVRDMKEHLGYVALDFKKEMKRPGESPTQSREPRRQVYELPDCSTIRLEREWFRSAEILFDPSLYGCSMPGIPEMITNCIRTCAEEDRNELMQNVVLCGATSRFEGLRPRVHNDVSRLMNSKEVDVRSVPEKHSVWVGASILTKLLSAAHWISKEDYDDAGASVAHRKCL